MKLIAKKPCSYGGKQFFIGEEVPINLVTDVRQQEKLGVLVVLSEEREQIENSRIPIEVVLDGTKEQLFVDAEEIQQVFSIMQKSAEEGIRIVMETEKENVLLLLLAADNRKTIKNAVKEQLGLLQG